MNNTLTGLGLALVLALLAALIGPWFINWSAYRDDFAKQASDLIGAPVSVSGAIDARLLPSPYVRFRGLTAGSGARAISVDEVEVTLEIAPLLRGEFKAERVRLVRPRVTAEIGVDGVVHTAFSGARKGPPGSISFDEAEIADGSLNLKAPSGDVSLTRINGLAEAGSLAGPYRFEGALTSGGSKLEAKLSTARIDDKGAMRVKLSLKREGRPETFDLDGGLTVAAHPAFDGRAVLARPAQRVKDREPGLADQPWRVEAQVKADASRLSATTLDLAFGSDERGIRLGGKGQVTLGPKPRFDVALDSRQIDLDRALGRKGQTTPAEMIARLAREFGGFAKPPLDGKLSLDIRGVVLAGDVVQGVSAEMETEAGGWSVRRAKAELPASTTLSAGGAIAFSGDAPGFAGDVDFATQDLAGFRRWLAGGQEIAALLRNLALKGHVATGAGELSIENATLVADGARSTGRLAWKAAGAGGRGRIEAALTSEELDLDALGLDRILKQAIANEALDVVLALDAKSLTFSTVKMSGVSIDAVGGDDGVDIRRLDIRDMGGAALTGAGRIARGTEGLTGHVSADLSASRLGSLIALARAAGAAEPALDALATRAEALAPVKLQIDVEAAAAGGTATVRGDAAGGRLDLSLKGRDLSLDAPAEIDLKLASADGRRLAGLAGIAVSPVASAQGGEIALKLSGAPAKGMTGEGRFSALGLDLRSKGAVALAPLVGISGEGSVTLASDDLASVGEATGRVAPGALTRLPAKLSAKAAFGPEEISFDELNGDVAGVALRGRLAAPRDLARPITGALAFDELPTGAIAALVAPASPAGEEAGGQSIWSRAPFGPALARGLSGRIDVTAKRVSLGEHSPAATEASFTLVLRPNGLGVEAFAAALGGGRLSGSANAARSGDDATVSVTASLKDVALAGLAGASSPPVSGVADGKFEAQATGKSPAALAGALTGAGNLTVRDARLRGLDVGAIDRVEPKVDAGLALEAPKIAEAIDRDLSGRDAAFGELAIPFTLSGGVLRTGSLSAANGEARLGGGASIDVRRLTLDANLTLQPDRPDAPQIGVAFEGPVSGPVRRIDATGLTSWLSVRAVERETKRIEAMEADVKERARLARLRADEERRKAEEEKKRLDEERRKAEAERKKREAENRALLEAMPKPAPSTSPGLPSALDLTPPGVTAPNRPPASPQSGVFGAGQPRPGPTRAPSTDQPQGPRSILPPAAVSPGR